MRQRRRLDRRWRRRRRGASGASGTLNWEWELPTSWDPVTSSAGWDMHALGLVYASITTLDPKGTVEAGLASSWQYAANGKSVTFQLRPGLKFTDGTALDADAVKENIVRGQTQSNSTEASELSVISKVVVNSATSFTLDLTQVDYQVPDLLAGKDGMMVSPASFKSVGSIPTQPVGAGPFKLTSYVPDSHADLVRNPGYWDASQIHIANFTVQDITEPEQILAALQSGQVNVAYIAGNQVAAAEAAGFKVDVIPSEVVDELDIQTTTRAVQQPGRGRGDQLRHQPAGDPHGPGVGVRGDLLPAVPQGVRRLQLQARQPLPVQPRRWPSSCSPRPGTRTG